MVMFMFQIEQLVKLNTKTKSKPVLHFQSLQKRAFVLTIELSKYKQFDNAKFTTFLNSLIV